MHDQLDVLIACLKDYEAFLRQAHSTSMPFLAVVLVAMLEERNHASCL